MRIFILVSILGSLTACATSNPSGCENSLRGAGSDLLMETLCRL